MNTKADLGSRDGVSRGALRVSAITGAGLESLREAIQAAVAASAGAPDSSGGAVSTARQRRAIEAAASDVREFIRAWSANALPAPVAATHVRAAMHALDEFIGVVASDDVLEEVFRVFCVGK